MAPICFLTHAQHQSSRTSLRLKLTGTRAYSIIVQSQQAHKRKAGLQRAAVRAAATSKKVLMMGGTRFIGLYLARQLVEAGHDVTLFTRGKSDVTPQIPDDTDESYKNFKECDAAPVPGVACDMCLPEPCNGACRLCAYIACLQVYMCGSASCTISSLRF